MLAYQEYYSTTDYQQWKGDWELIGGMPYAMSPSPSVSHQSVAAKLTSQLINIVSSANKTCVDCTVLMETDWYVSNDTVVRPDVLMVCRKVDERVIVAPELIVEVVSASSSKRDEVMKFELYQKEGVVYYILVYPEIRIAKVYKNNNSGFSKVGDFSSEQSSFKIKNCGFTIDFGSIWR